MTQLPVDRITSSVQVRNLKAFGVTQLETSIRTLGYLSHFPLLVTPVNGGYRLIDGNHRLEAICRLGLTDVPCEIVENLTDIEQLQQALRSNEASETVIPMTFVDHAEFVWEQARQDMTQAQIGEVLGWSRGQVSNYVALEKIDKEAWRVIATTFEKTCGNIQEEGVAGNATTVANPFTEGLLRDLVPLTPKQQR